MACLLFGIAAGATTVAAAPRKVLVLPLDGSAPPALRRQLDARVRAVAADLGTVSPGDTTLAETAAAVGCDPARPACVDDVISMLAIDELVWGTATTGGGQVSVVVHVASRGEPARARTIVLPPRASADQVDPELHALFAPDGVGATGAAPGAQAIDTASHPAGPEDTSAGRGSDPGASGVAPEDAASPGLAGSAPAPSPGSAPAPSPGSAPALAVTRDPGGAARRDRDLGIGLAIGGGVALLAGFALWLEEGSVQRDIDHHPTNTLSDIATLRDLENQAGGYASGGNLLVFVGLGLGAAGGYYLWRAHRGHVTAIAPAPAERGTGMTLTIGGRW